MKTILGLLLGVVMLSAAWPDPPSRVQTTSLSASAIDSSVFGIESPLAYDLAHDHGYALGVLERGSVVTNDAVAYLRPDAMLTGYAGRPSHLTYLTQPTNLRPPRSTVEPRVADLAAIQGMRRLRCARGSSSRTPHVT